MVVTRSTKCVRQAFTLLELLVVIAIIATLAAIAVGAYFRAAAGQAQKRTETAIRKLALALDNQWNAVLDDVRNEIKNGKVSQVPNLLNDAGNDRDRANALYLKMRLAQEFPQTFAEAQLPVNHYLPNGKAYYTNALTGPIPPEQQIPLKHASHAQLESAVLLYLSLSQNRRGTSSNVDDIGGINSVTLPGTTYRVFLDSWGQVICFERWPGWAAPPAAPQPGSALYPTAYTRSPSIPMHVLVDELTSNLYAKPDSNKVAGNYDTQDPLSKLYAANNPPTNWPKSMVFQQLLHPFDGYNRVPTIYSLGSDTFPALNLGVPGTQSMDDIYSFRLMAAGRAGN